MDYFYDEQIRRYLATFIRAMSSFTVKMHLDDGSEAYREIPVFYGAASRQASHIIRQNSENTLNTIPAMSVWIQGMDQAREFGPAPTHEEKIHIQERKYDKNVQAYLTSGGDTFTVERLMPVPYSLTLNLDIVASSSGQKLEILEQILYFFRPDIALQSSDNYLDYTAVTRALLTGINYSSNSVPQGIEDELDYATLTFEMKPIWITPPARISKRGVIEKIVVGIFDGQGDLAGSVLNNNLLMGSRQYFTPLNYGVLLIDGKLRALEVMEAVSGQTKPDYEIDHVPQKLGDPVLWDEVFAPYSEIRDGISQIKLMQTFHDAHGCEVRHEVVGAITRDPNDPYVLDFTVDVDTIPTNNLSPVNAIIDPLKSGPDTGLPTATTGQRYLLMESIGHADNTDGADAWKGTGGEELVASENDIIEYDGTQWNVSFDASAETGNDYMTNLTTNLQYKWTGEEWVLSFDGEYLAGIWSLII